MRNAVPVLTVVAGLFAVWYLAAIWLNAPWAYDKATRAGVTLSASELVSDTWAQDKPKLPAPHQVAAEIWKTTGAMVAKGRGFSKRSLIYHSWISLSATLLGFAMCYVVCVLRAVVSVYNWVRVRSVMPWVLTSHTIPIVGLSRMIFVVLNAIGRSWLLP